MRSREIKRRLGIAGRGGLRFNGFRRGAFFGRLSQVNLRGFKQNFFRACVLAVILLIFAGLFGLLRPGIRVRVDADTVAAFRVPHRAIGMLRVYAARNGISFPELFAVFNAENGFFPEKHAVYDLSVLESLYVRDFNRLLRRYNSRSLAPYVTMFENLFGEIETFPIPMELYEGEIMFGDTWGFNFQGNTLNMGTAIIDRENIRGRVPVVSMTRGTVRDAGFDSGLGYFVGIVTENGTYYLYAHLDSITPGLASGQVVTAGQPLGRMGNTGGGRDTRNFPVHLHLEIQPDVSFTRGNFRINPYPLLRYIENPAGF